MDKRFSRALILGFLLVAVGLAGCSLGKSSEEMALEIILPEDSEIVIGFDYADDEQVKALKALLDKFPKAETYKEIGDALKAEISDSDKSVLADYTLLLKPFIGDDWELVAGITPVNESEADVVVAGKFEKDDEFEKFMKTMISKSNKTFTESEEGDVKYWSNEVDKVYLARSGDVFLVSNNVKTLNGAVERLLEGKGGFADSEHFEKLKNLSAQQFAYIYLGGDFSNIMLKEVGAGDLKMGSSYSVLTAEDLGVRVVSSSEWPDKASMEKLVPGHGKKFDFLSKLPNQDLFFYNETGTLITIFNGAPNPIYSGLLDSFASWSGLEEEQIKGLFDAPMAVVMSDVEMLYPGISVYLDIEKDSEEDAKIFLNAMDGFMDDVIKEFDLAMEGSGYEGLGLLKREVEIESGVPMRKVYADLSVIPKETLNGISLYAPGIDFDNLKVEFYYGVDQNGMLVFALYPGFNDLDLSDVLGENERMKGALQKLNLSDVNGVSFTDFGPIFAIADRYVEMAKKSQFVTPEQVADIERIYGAVKNTLLTLDYSVSARQVDGKIVKSEAYMAIGSQKVER